MSVPPPTKRERRAARACDTCRGRKIRCLGLDEDQRICKRCLAMGLQCTFDQPIKRPLPSSQVELMQAKIRHLERRLARRGGRNHSDNTQSSLPSDEDDEDDDDGRDRHATSTSSSVSEPSNSANSPLAYIPNYVPISDSDRTCPEEIISTSSHTTNSREGFDQAQTERGSRRVLHGIMGSTAALYPLAASHIIPRTATSVHMADELRKRVRLEYWQWDVSEIESKLDEELHAFWPSQEEASRLFDAFFNSRGSVGPTMAIDPVLLQRDHRSGPSGGVSRVRLARIYAICALSAWHCELGLEMVNNRSFLAGLHWWFASRRLLLMMQSRYDQLAEPLEKAQTYILQAAYSTSRPMMIQNSWHLAGDAIRVLVDVGLHRRDTSQNLGRAAKERHETFWAAYSVEKMITIAMGRCSMLSSEWFDAEPPREEENLAQWCDVETMMVSEQILRAKYAYRGGRSSAKALRSIEARLEHLSHRLEHHMSADQDLRPSLIPLQITIDSVQLLYLCPDILAQGPEAASAMITLETILRRLLADLNELDVEQHTPFSPAAAVRAIVLSHFLSGANQPPEIQQRFSPYTRRGLRWLRTLESRFMHAGKVGDMLMLPVIKDATTAAPENPSSHSHASSLLRKRKSSWNKARESASMSTMQSQNRFSRTASLGTSPQTLTQSRAATRTTGASGITGLADRDQVSPNSSFDLPSGLRAAPLTSSSHLQQPQLQVPMSFSRTGSQAGEVIEPSATQVQPLSWPSMPRNTAQNSCLNARMEWPPPPAAEFGTSQSSNSLIQSQVLDGGGGDAPTSGFGEAGDNLLGGGGLDLTSLDAQDVARLFFDYEYMPSLTAMEGWIT